MQSENADESLYEDDDSHPIPYVYHCDVNAVQKSGGSELSIVVASPLDCDERSQRRLIKKIENYLIFIGSDEFQVESGVATPDNTQIVVHLHPESHIAISDLLSRSVSWVLAYNATLVVKNL